MRGVSEVVVNVLLLAITVAASTLLFSIFFNVYTQQQSRLVVEGAGDVCVARVFDVGNVSGVARFYIYNRGNVACIFDKAYIYSGSAVAGPWSVSSCRVAPQSVSLCDSSAPYRVGVVYRLTGPRGEVAEVSWPGP
ncbi:archaellin/type IV pilin N-terminal domain-containing protein [Pyrobaculum ferrireducens]|nr:archaellin/type IV pilin N-terminal domain-containing protein [Pyrobaculum ferrireducens]